MAGVQRHHLPPSSSLLWLVLVSLIFCHGCGATKVWKLKRHHVAHGSNAAAACANAVKCDFVEVVASIRFGLARTTVLCPVTNRKAFPCDGTLVVPLSPNAVVTDCSIVASGTVLVGRVVPSLGYQSFSSRVDRKSRFTLPNYYGAKSAVLRITVGSHQTVIFNLTYQEVLPSLKHNFYKYVVEFYKSKVSGPIKAEVNIVDTRRVLRTHVPPMRPEAKETPIDELLEEQMDPNTVVRSRNANGRSTVRIKYSARSDGQGSAGQLVILFQVEVPGGGHDLQVHNSYFLLRFVPFFLAPLKRHLVLILDKTGFIPESKQRKMEKFVSRVLSELHPTDQFNVLVNSDEVHRWRDKSATAEHRHAREALRFIQCIPATGQNGLDKAFVEAFKLIDRRGKNHAYHSIVVLTNEEASLCEKRLSPGSADLKRTVNLYEGCQVLSVGYETEDHVDWLRQLSTVSSGLVANVHDFDVGLLSPLLYGVQLKLPHYKVHTGTAVNSSDKIFMGREFVAMGKLKDNVHPLSAIELAGKTARGDHFRTVLSVKRRAEHGGGGGGHKMRTVSMEDAAERLWSHLFLSDLMQRRFLNKMNHLLDEDLENQALMFCLKYNYVTDLTKIVFDTPNNNFGLELLIQENIPIRQLQDEWSNPTVKSIVGGAQLQDSQNFRNAKQVNICEALYAQNQKKALERTVCKRNHTLVAAVDDRKVSRISRSVAVPGDKTEDKQASKCSRNEHFTDCGPASGSCQLTCSNYEQPPMCPMVCGPGQCVCNVGYVRGPQGECTKPERCQETASNITAAKCKENEVYKKCGLPRSECETTCQNIRQPPVCIEICGFEGCFCKDGFVRNKNWVCIPPEQCSKDVGDAQCEHAFQDNGCQVCECSDKTDGCPPPSLCLSHCPYDVRDGDCHFCNCSERDEKEIYWTRQQVPLGGKNQTVCFDLQLNRNQTYALYHFGNTGVIVTAVFRTVRRNFRRWLTFEWLKIRRGRDYVLVENDQVSVQGFSNETLKLFDQTKNGKFSRIELSLEGKKIAEIRRRKLTTCECGAKSDDIWLLDVKSNEATDGLFRKVDEFAKALQLDLSGVTRADGTVQGMEAKMTIPRTHPSGSDSTDEQLKLGSRLVRRKDWMHDTVFHCYQISLSLLKPFFDPDRFVVHL